MVLAPRVRSVVPDCVASQDIYGGDEYKYNSIEYGEMSPLVPYVGKHSSFACIAIITQFVLPITPCGAVRIIGRWTRLWHFPERSVLHFESTVRGGLAAP